MTTPASVDGCLLLCRTLQRLGATHVFGLPGTQNVALYEAMRQSRLKAVVPTHELAAAFMAGAYFRACGRPGVLATIPGPGLAYTIAALAEARLDSAAIVYIVNAPQHGSRPGFGPQAIDQHALLAPVTKAILTANDIDDLPALVRRAYALSMSGEPGPVVLELAGDRRSRPAHARSSEPRSPTSDGDAARAWRRIAEARRPVFLLGQGALPAAATLGPLIQRTGAPVLTTPSARGIVPESAPYAMGADVLKGTTGAVNTLLAAADLIVVLGAKLGHNGSAGSALVLAPEKTVRIDASRQSLSTVYPASDALEMDVARFLAHPGAAAAERSQWREADLANWRSAISPPVPQAMEPRIAGASAAAFFATLRRSLSPETILVTDTGLHQVMARRYFPVEAPRGLLFPSDFQSMGFGLPAAIAAKLACPDRPVVAILGDGGFRMTGLELQTIAREKIALPMIVLNDGRLNQIRMQQLGEWGTETGVELGPLDLGAIAAATGVRHVRVSADPEEAISAAVASAAPTLIEVLVADSPAVTVGTVKARTRGAVRSIVRGRVGRHISSLLGTGRG